MTKKTPIEIDANYEDKLNVLRKVFVSPEGKVLEDNGELLEGLINTFIEFLQNQPGAEGAEHEHKGDCCGGH